MGRSNNIHSGIGLTDLIPRSSRKSFCGKAKTITTSDGWRFLLSYDIIMGAYDKDGKPHRYSNYHSLTTGCHVKSFFRDSDNFWKLPLEKQPTVRVSL